MFKFNWFKKTPKEPEKSYLEPKDSLEIALWEIKERYDLETEEIERAVFEKRNNINYMNECLKNDKVE